MTVAVLVAVGAVVAVGVGVAVAVDVGVAVGVAVGAATKVITPFCAETGMAMLCASAKVSTVTLNVVDELSDAMPVACQVIETMGN